jgi:hypothetical protein
MMREIWLWEGKEKEEERGETKHFRQGVSEYFRGTCVLRFSDSNSNRGYDIG